MTHGLLSRLKSALDDFMHSPILARFLDAGMIVGPILGFIPQYKEIATTGNTEAFSSLVCFILLTANILRIYYWVYERFTIVLVLQALLMIAVQLMLLELMARLRLKSSSALRAEDRLFSRYIRGFWQWDRFGDYVAFLALFTVLVGIATSLDRAVLHTRYYGEAIGILALMVEASLGLPQLYRNWSAKSTKGLRFELIIAWLIGDVLKTCYFVFKRAPPLFVMCGSIQLTVDISILAQILVYRKRQQAAEGLAGIPVIRCDFLCVDSEVADEEAHFEQRTPLPTPARIRSPAKAAGLED